MRRVEKKSLPNRAISLEMAIQTHTMRAVGQGSASPGQARSSPTKNRSAPAHAGMGETVAFTIAFVLAVLSALHVYWGVEGIESSAVIPEIDGKPAFIPDARDCYTVAAALALASIIVTTRGGLLRSPLPDTWTQIATFSVGAMLAVRAIGDFHLMGFFKRVRGTTFAEWDTRLFSPVCLLLGLATLWVALSETTI